MNARESPKMNNSAFAQCLCFFIYPSPCDVRRRGCALPVLLLLLLTWSRRRAARQHSDEAELDTLSRRYRQRPTDAFIVASPAIADRRHDADAGAGTGAASAALTDRDTTARAGNKARLLCDHRTAASGSDVTVPAVSVVLR